MPQLNEFTSKLHACFNEEPVQLFSACFLVSNDEVVCGQVPALPVLSRIQLCASTYGKCHPSIPHRFLPAVTYSVISLYIWKMPSTKSVRTSSFKYLLPLLSVYHVQLLPCASTARSPFMHWWFPGWIKPLTCIFHNLRYEHVKVIAE